jgi:hypothetical protein
MPQLPGCFPGPIKLFFLNLKTCADVIAAADHYFLA